MAFDTVSFHFDLHGADGASKNAVFSYKQPEIPGSREWKPYRGHELDANFWKTLSGSVGRKEHAGLLFSYLLV